MISRKSLKFLAQLSVRVSEKKMNNVVTLQPETPQQGNRFECILKLSRIMLKDSSKGKWGRILKMQTDRQQMLDNYFAKPVSPADAEKVATGIREMLDIDRTLMDRGRKQMGELSADMRNINQGVKAKQAYVENML